MNIVRTTKSTREIFEELQEESLYDNIDKTIGRTEDQGIEIEAIISRYE